MKRPLKKTRSFRHIRQSDRDRMEALLKEGHLQKEIAEILGFDPGAISRERKRRRKNGVYDATTAQRKANVKRGDSKYQGMKITKYPQLEKRIVSELTAKRSPDEIAGRMKQESLIPRAGTAAIYKWLYSSRGNKYAHLLCTHRYKRRKQRKNPKREMIPDRIPLVQRPKEGEHAEGDLFVSPIRSGTSRSGVLLSVPSAKLLVGRMIGNRKPTTMVLAVNAMLPSLSILDITWDNGVENKRHKEFLLPSYFCDPYSPWQKPHVENSILLIRRWFIPKKTDLTNVSDEDYRSYLHILNHKYRKSLGYKSAYEVALERGIIRKIPLSGDGGK